MHRRRFVQIFANLMATTIATLCHSKFANAFWPAEHFAAGEFNTHFAHLFANQSIIDSDDIEINLPEIAEDGAVVPITISSNLDQISKIYIWVEKNPTPLAAEFELSTAVSTYLTARIKMAESCNVVVIAQQGERLLRRQRWVKVMQGGCGTG